jgi:hypothetical protein
LWQGANPQANLFLSLNPQQGWPAMKTIQTLLYLTFIVMTGGCAFAQADFASTKWTVMLKVVDDDGKPVAEADAWVVYMLPPRPGQTSYDKLGSAKIEGLTDTNGVFSASHSSSSQSLAWGLGIHVQKTGYYPTYLNYQLYLPDQFDAQKVYANHNPTLEMVLKKIGKPIPMYAKNIESLRVPELNKAIGYDLMIGDWVGPYGKGINAELFFTEKHTDPQSGYILSMSFPNPGDGIQEFTVPDAEKGSGLRSAHAAPVDGYQSEVAQTEMTNPKRNFYFRVRTKLDENGNVVSARYGKIYGDLAQFTYYLNPTINDRNVEFDPKQNLLKNLKSNEGVESP